MMDAVEFFKQIKRIFDRGIHECEECPLKTLPCDATIYELATSFDENKLSTIVELIEQFADEHPMMTRQSKFLNDFPRTFLQDGVINICPKAVDSAYKPENGCPSTTCCECRSDYWMTEVKL